MVVFSNPLGLNTSGTLIENILSTLKRFALDLSIPLKVTRSILNGYSAWRWKTMFKGFSKGPGEEHHFAQATVPFS
jgi:hypothetical protein